MGRERFQALPRFQGKPPLIRVYQMPAVEISHLTNLVEAYDGIGLVRTLDASRGIVELWIMPDFVETFDKLIASLQKEFPMHQMPGNFD